MALIGQHNKPSVVINRVHTGVVVGAFALKLIHLGSTPLLSHMEYFKNSI